MFVQYPTPEMNYGQANMIVIEWERDGRPEPMTPEQALAYAMMSPIPKEIDLTPLVAAIGEGPIPEGTP